MPSKKGLNPESNSSPIFLRGAYSTSPFLVDSVSLQFDLAAEESRVRSVLQIRRNPNAPAEPDLELKGRSLRLDSLKLNGRPTQRFELSSETLVLRAVPSEFTLEVETVCQPATNLALEGLYASGCNLITQCEPEGFRRISYFPDRPDVMSTFRVHMIADRERFPVLLSNGNLLDSGDLPDGRHFAKWDDPFKKPAYLFALVAGQLVSVEKEIVTKSGVRKLLQIWVAARDVPRTHHALDALHKAVQWDEERYELELDLDRYMIVAVSDFNMGAMENKGLNIFNSKYILADADTSTDDDFTSITSVVGHEYFHNWTGNRVGCRDWFQLSLKEGLTVFRDQEFSADVAAMDAGETAAALRRISDVRALRQAQFPEDSSPLAHPVRPESYLEISNFYTNTVYRKGAEVVRMYQTLFGRSGFRKGMDLFIARHDGQAATCDDFRAAMADANGRNLDQFERWYSQAGTPKVSAVGSYDASARTYTLSLEQHAPTALNPDIKARFRPLLIPVRLALLSREGVDLPLEIEGERLESPAPTERIIELHLDQRTIVFQNIEQEPVPSLFRGFSAPVVCEFEYSTEQLAFLLSNDTDPFNRWDAGQSLAVREMLYMANQLTSCTAADVSPLLIDSFASVINNRELSPAFQSSTLTLPSEIHLCGQMAEAEPSLIHDAWIATRRALGTALASTWMDTYVGLGSTVFQGTSPLEAGQRALRNLALQYLAESEVQPSVLELARSHYENAENLTDRVAAIEAMMIIQASSSFGEATRVLEDVLLGFYRKYEGNELVVDKWMALQASQRSTKAARTVDIVRHLMGHTAFNANNPNSVRALIFTFCTANPVEFHRRDGSGYALWLEWVTKLDRVNPQVAARLARALDSWRKFAPGQRTAMKDALTVAKKVVRSNEVREIVSKLLG
jgi:aminopeptidase N